MGLARVITTIVKSFTGMFETVELYQSKEVPSLQIASLNITTSSSKVVLIPSDDEKITLELKGQVSRRLEDIYTLETNQTNDALNIVVSKQRTFILIGFIIDRSQLQVRVPKKWYDMLSIQTTSGSVEGEGLTSRSLRVNTASGSVRMNHLETKGKLAIRTASGSIRAHTLKSQEKIQLNASSGSIEARGVEVKDLEVGANSGRLDLQNTLTQDVSLRTGSGSITSREMKGNLIAKSGSGSVRLSCETLEGEWDIKTGSGSVAVSIDHPESLAVKFVGGSGSGKVNLPNMEYQMKTEHSFLGQIGSGENKLKVKTGSGSFRLN